MKENFFCVRRENMWESKCVCKSDMKLDTRRM